MIKLIKYIILDVDRTLVDSFEPELLSLSESKYKDLFKSNKKLEEYKVNLDKIYRNKEHVLSEKEEVIINEVSSAMDHFEDMSSTMLNTLNKIIN